MTSPRVYFQGAGTQTAAIAAYSTTELYDGTSWAVTTTLLTPRTSLGASGTQTTSLVFGGNAPTSSVTLTEEFTGAGPVTVTITGT